MDRASVYGTDNASAQPLAKQGACDYPADALCHRLCHFAAEIAPVAPDLADVLTAWPTLPDALKAVVLAIVKTSTQPPKEPK